MIHLKLLFGKGACKYQGFFQSTQKTVPYIRQNVHMGKIYQHRKIYIYSVYPYIHVFSQENLSTHVRVIVIAIIFAYLRNIIVGSI